MKINKISQAISSQISSTQKKLPYHAFIEPIKTKKTDVADTFFKTKKAPSEETLKAITKYWPF